MSIGLTCLGLLRGETQQLVKSTAWGVPQWDGRVTIQLGWSPTSAYCGGCLPGSRSMAGPSLEGGDSLETLQLRQRDAYRNLLIGFIEKCTEGSYELLLGVRINAWLWEILELLYVHVSEGEQQHFCRSLAISVPNIHLSSKWILHQGGYCK